MPGSPAELHVSKACFLGEKTLITFPKSARIGLKHIGIDSWADFALGKRVWDLLIHVFPCDRCVFT